MQSDNLSTHRSAGLHRTQEGPELQDDWDLDDIPAGTVDPTDAYRRGREDRGEIAYTGPSRVTLPNLQPEPTPPPSQDTLDGAILRMRRDVPVERAMLAMADPDGERDAVAPLTPVRARQVVLEAAATRPVTGPTRDGRDLVIRLGGDPGRPSGRVPCPAHGGRDRNLSWRLSPDGRVLLKCFSHGCTFAEIVEAIR